MSSDELFEFAEEPASDTPDIIPESRLSDWKVLVIDDEAEVHKVTRMVLSGFEFAGRKIELLSAYSAKEAETLLQEYHDIAVALVDVVMESDDAGLDLVRRIRETHKNTSIRLVLRTGQPGQAPEEKVIVDYDINDYKDKTELTAIKLKTLMYSSLRAYRDIMALENNRKGLRQVIESSADIFELRSLRRFFSAVLCQLTSLLDLRADAAYVKATGGIAATSQGNRFEIMAGTGAYEGLAGQSGLDVLPEDIRAALMECSEHRINVYHAHHIVVGFQSRSGVYNLLYVENFNPLTETDIQLIEIFCANASIAFENACLKTEIEETQRETVCLLGEAVENRSQETGNHVKRVAEISAFLARAAGLSEIEIEIIRAAAPLHDLGKVGIADAILHKPGIHDETERELMREHVRIGYEMLSSSTRPVLKCAAVIAHQHHEAWDGSGYPRGLQGEDIALEGRIVAVADVFDALSSKRCYKEAWSDKAVMEYFRTKRGSQFDPQLVDVLLDNLDTMAQIRRQYPDEPEDSSE